MENKEGGNFTGAFVDGEIVKIENDSIVGTSINELGGVVAGGKKIDEPETEDAPKKDTITETMADGKKVVITEDGSRYDAETGELILKGSDD